ncbi:matrix metalloproteinase-21-like [Ranitomeya variabilis]|uniref:matrix metalloproteinase-21-like n=1 Tax=Ranitomeya variabilis TaxID=490064 RepID=UPI004055E5B5
METKPALLTLLFIHLSTGERLYYARDGSDIQSQSKNKAQSIITKTYAQKYLWKYGWIEPVRWDSLLSRTAPSASGENVAPADISSLLREDKSFSSTQPVIHELPEPSINPRFIRALKKFQEANRLKVTGELDEATQEAMSAPRCGVPDRKIPEVEKNEYVNPTEIATSIPYNGQKAEYLHFTSSATPIMPSSERIRREMMGAKKRIQSQLGDNQELGRHVRKKRSDLIKAGTKNGAFSKPTIKWRLLGEGYSVWLTINQQRSILMRAFRIWSEVVPLNFEEDLISPAHLIDIKLGFGTRRHLGCSQLFDGTGREFAHAWRLGDIHFDDDEHFVPPNSEQGISLLKVAVHEIGHVLGLSHMNDLTSVMQPNYIPANSRMELDGADRREIQRVYGRCSGRFSTVFDWLLPNRSAPASWVFQTYFFRRSWYWMYENRNNRTRYRDPRVVSGGWRGIPHSDIDAFVQFWTRDKDFTLFFKARQGAEKISNQLAHQRTRGSTETQRSRKASNMEEKPASVQDGCPSGEKLSTHGRTQYWRYDNENDRAYVLDPDGHVYPRLISEGFPGVSGPIDSAFYDHEERIIYFFRGRNVTAFSVTSYKVVPGYPKAIIDVFPAYVPGDHPQSDLDAVYYSFTHRNVFFIKGVHVWRMAGGQQESVHHNALLPRIPINEQWLDICDVHPSMLSAPR